MERNQPAVDKATIYMVMIGMFLTGAANTIALKIQNLTPVGGSRFFYHPLIQCLFMFIGEFLCLAVHFAQRCYETRGT